jgi:hypothetical protein
MAKAKPNKSQAIRDQLQSNPKASIKEVIEALATKGIKVNYNLVYTIRGKGQSKNRKQKRAAAVSAGLKSGMNDPASAVMRGKAARRPAMTRERRTFTMGRL